MMASFQGYQRLAFFGLTVAAKTLLDFEDEFTVTMIEAWYGLVSTIITGILLYIYFQIQYTKEFHEEKISVRESQLGVIQGRTPKKDEPKSQITIAEYDMNRWYELIYKLSLPMFITIIVHWYYELVLPLLIVSFTLPKSLSSEKLFEVHVLGKNPKNPIYRLKYSRPWQPNVMYPRWMQKYMDELEEGEKKAPVKAGKGKKKKK